MTSAKQFLLRKFYLELEKPSKQNGVNKRNARNFI